jgi:Ca2+-binding EF-hand superfamily protein
VSKEKFDEIDTDGDGVITASELKASLEGTSGVSDDNIAAIVQMADDDGDQQISFDEYEKLLG